MGESPTTSSYPATIDTWTTLTDKEDLAEASDINKLKNSVISTQTELGTDVAGSATDLKTRLAVSIGDDGGVQGGSSYPGTPVGDQLFTRTDEDKLYRRNTGDTAWIEIGGGGHTLLSSTAVSAASASGNITINNQFLYLIKVDITATSSASCIFWIRFNSSASAVYWYAYDGKDTGGTSSAGNSASANQIVTGGTYDVSATDYNAHLQFTIGTQGTTSGKNKFVKGDIYGNSSGSAGRYNTFMGRFGGADVTDFEIVASTGTFTGTIYTYEYSL